MSKARLLSQVEVAWVDSAAALQAARRAGMPDGAEVRTLAPALLLDENSGAVAADRHMSTGGVVEMSLLSRALSAALVERIREHAVLGSHAVQLARCLNSAEATLYRAHCLDELDYRRPVAVVEVDGEWSRFGARLRSSWSELLQGHSQATVLRTPPPVVARPSAPPPPPFMERLRAARVSHLMYRAIERACSLLPRVPGLRTLLIATEKGESELMKETAFFLACRGYVVRRVSLAPRPRTPPDDFDRALHEVVPPFLAERLGDRLPQQVLGGVTRCLLEVMREQQSEYLSFRESAQDVIGAERRGALALLSSHIVSPRGRALAEACHAHRLPVVTFQHGVTREISPLQDRYEASFETSLSDLHFTYNATNAAVTNAGQLNHGRAYAVGMDRSQDARRRGRRPPSGDSGLWYINTMLYRGDLPGLGRGQSDREMARFEIELIDNTFSRLPHRVVYKPYPFMRYPDPDPVIERASSVANIDLYLERHDLRYLLDQIRVLITSRATSTLGWCIGSGLPVVFIDLPEEPLVPEARSDLEEALILIDGSRPRLFSDLLAVLSRPLEKIEAEYAEKAAARARAIERWFDCGDGHAGAEAGRILLAEVAKRRPAEGAA